MKRVTGSEFKRILQQDARRQEMAFSPLLHERVMQALHAQGLKEQGQEERSPRWAWRAGAPLGIAAAVAVAAFAFFPSSSGHRETPDGGMVSKPAIPHVPTNIAEPIRLSVGAPAADVLDQSKYAYLDRDAEKLISFVARQVPSVPTR